MGRPLSGQPSRLVDADLRMQREGGAAPVCPCGQVDAHTVTPTVVAIEHVDGWLGPAAFRTQGAVTMVEGNVYSNMTLVMSTDASEVQSGGRTRPKNWSEMEGTIVPACSRDGCDRNPRSKARLI